MFRRFMAWARDAEDSEFYRITIAVGLILIVLAVASVLAVMRRS